jgi:hypothetical protein
MPPGCMATAPEYDIDTIRRRIPSLERSVPMHNSPQTSRIDLTQAREEPHLESWRREGERA